MFPEPDAREPLARPRSPSRPVQLVVPILLYHAIMLFKSTLRAGVGALVPLVDPAPRQKRCGLTPGECLRCSKLRSSIGGA